MNNSPHSTCNSPPNYPMGLNQLIMINRSLFISIEFFYLFIYSFYCFLPCRFRRQGIVFFVFLSSGNTSTANNFNISWLISTKLGHNNFYLRGIMSHDQQGVKGHVGVKGHFSLKMILLLQILSHGHVTYKYEASTCPIFYLCFFSRSEV